MQKVGMVFQTRHSADIPEDVAALGFNLYDDGDNRWPIELVGTERFDEEDEDWSCDEVTDFGIREGLLTWSKEAKWEAVLEKVCIVLEQYLEKGEFVDGDVKVLFM